MLIVTVSPSATEDVKPKHATFRSSLEPYISSFHWPSLDSQWEGMQRGMVSTGRCEIIGGQIL